MVIFKVVTSANRRFEEEIPKLELERENWKIRFVSFYVMLLTLFYFRLFYFITLLLYLFINIIILSFLFILFITEFNVDVVARLP